MRKTVGDQLLDLKNRSNLSLSEIARLAGYRGASSLQRYFNASYDADALDYRTAQRLAEALEGAGDPPITQFDVMSLTVPADKDGARATFVPVQHDKETKGLVPIYHTILFDYEVMDLSDPPSVDAIEIDYSHPVESLRCPPSLERRDVYGFYMVGLSMSPRFFPGQVVFTDGRKPPSAGDDVLIILNEDEHEGDELHAIFAQMTEMRRESLVLKHYSGPTFSIEQSAINQIRRVMHAAELLGGYVE